MPCVIEIDALRKAPIPRGDGEGPLWLRNLAFSLLCYP